ncbi:GTPase HflX, partial [Clostridioides difficile]
MIREKSVLCLIDLLISISFNELMIELENLCSACDIDVVGSITQNAKQVNRAFYIGTGKVE